MEQLETRDLEAKSETGSKGGDGEEKESGQGSDQPKRKPRLLSMVRVTMPHKNTKPEHLETGDWQQILHRPVRGGPVQQGSTD